MKRKFSCKKWLRFYFTDAFRTEAATEVFRTEAVTGGVLYKKGVLKYFAKLTGKHLAPQSLF